MKKIIYTLSLVLLIVFSNSCEDQHNEEPTIITTEDITLDALLRPLDSHIGTVLGLSTNSQVKFSIVSQNVEGAVKIDQQGNIIVDDTSAFDAERVNTTIIVKVLVSDNSVEETSIVTINLKYRDTDGDGVFDFEEVDNNTDLNNPCDPVQDKEYTGFDVTNKIWSVADCDDDGTTNGEEVNDGTNPYDPCNNNVATSIWAGSVELTYFGSTNTVSTTASCRSLGIQGDWFDLNFGDFSFCNASPEFDETILSFVPEFEGAKKGTVVINNQIYLPTCDSFSLIQSTSLGTYDEDTKTIIFEFGQYFEGEDPNDPDFFGYNFDGEVIIKAIP
ncbi:hypothetical protein A8C32_19065 [Flavivirga aquatica]|uniref:Cadherin domain-containing protein n=1 Tax=Flavivirga aquatica TaxID=1849968 RepID=A0A1E5T413_9FLAO|nr:cadherin repeat domain-containing protein [Flavivirga aquatica]OEK06133.1 hypothetical protein A8C32_19065 [Flavivirga aquatica]